ncbi:MAG: hypothetical protein KF712_03035 [Akkermansiaceae bacterium]|nr:hypothetical protein [Akkermansiaceae bacterium]
MNSLSLLIRITALSVVSLILPSCDDVSPTGTTGSGSQGMKAWVKAPPAIAAPSWQIRAGILWDGGRQGYPGKDGGLIEMVTDPGGEKRWKRYLEKKGCREIPGRTEVWVVGREREFRAIRLEGDETIWWVTKDELERPWGRR